MKSLYFVLLFALFTASCTDLGSHGDSADDDDSSDDDDISNADDDDSASEAKAGDDDDSGAEVEPGDDDDSAADPGVAFVNVTYCLEWSSVNFESPPNLSNILSGFGVTITDFPLLMSPTAVSLPVNEILMVMAGASPASCIQDTSLATYDLTTDQAGSYVSPHFNVGPSDISMSTQVANLNLYEAVFEGDFTGDASQVVNGRITGRLDVNDYAGFLCNENTGWDCSPCPTNQNLCVDLIASDAIWTDNGQGALMIVP